jgi:hypothetical protein
MRAHRLVSASALALFAALAFFAALAPGGAHAATAAPPPIAERVAQLDREQKAAKDAKDPARYRASLRAMDDLLHGHPQVVYALARAEALLGNARQALELLDRYAAMKLTRAGVAEDEAFIALRTLPAFVAVAARLAAGPPPVSRATHFATLPENDLVCDDIAYDPKTATFFIGSVRHRKILAVARSGVVAEFIGEGRDGLWAVLALAVDAPRRRLWVSTAAMPQALAVAPGDAGRSALLRFDLDSRKLVKRYDLPAPAPGEQQVLGDIALDAAGNVFASESVGGGLYTVTAAKDVLEPLVAVGTFLSPQSPAVAPDGKSLLVADYTMGIAVVDLGTRRTRWLAHPNDLALNGIDGLVLDGRSLLAVQNGTNPNRVVRLEVDHELSRITSWEVLESGSAQLGDPTHGVVVDGAFYFLGRTGWDRLDDDGTLKKDKTFDTAPVVLRFALH